QVLLGDDLEVLRAPDHVGEVAAPRGVDARGDLERIVDVVDARVRREAAYLGLLAEAEEARLHAELLPRPHRAGQAHARLYLVEDQEELELVGESPQPGEELRTEVVVAPFPLDRLDDEGSDVARAPCARGGVLRLGGLP